MNNVWPLDNDEWDSVDVAVFIPGPPGPPIVDVGTKTIPVAVVGSIAAPVNRRQRSFLVASGGPAVDPTIPNPGDNGPWEMYLFCTDDTNTITLNNQPNIKLSGEWIGKNGSILYLQWDGVSQYVEGGRNEI